MGKSAKASGKAAAAVAAPPSSSSSSSASSSSGSASSSSSSGSSGSEPAPPKRAAAIISAAAVTESAAGASGGGDAADEDVAARNAAKAAAAIAARAAKREAKAAEAAESAAAQQKKKKKAKGEQAVWDPTGDDVVKVGDRFTLFLGNLSFSADEAKLRAFFAPVLELPSDIVAIRMLTRKGTNMPKGAAFMDLATKKALVAALSLHHTKFLGREMNVELSAAGGGKKANRVEFIQRKNEVLKPKLIALSKEPGDGDGWIVPQPRYSDDESEGGAEGGAAGGKPQKRRAPNPAPHLADERPRKRAKTNDGGAAPVDDSKPWFA